MIWLVPLILAGADPDVRDVKIPGDAVEQKIPFRPWTFVKSKNRYFVGNELIGERMFYADGTLADERLFKNKKLHGIWRQYHLNGKLFAERPYRDGRMDGVFRFWDENGRLLGESELKDGTGVLREYENQPVHSEDRESPYVDGRRDGISKLWGKFDGCIGIGCSLSGYKDDRLDGWEITRDEDGTLIAYSYARRGKVHGVMRHFDRDGKSLPGYPRYCIDGVAVDESRFLDAAKSEKILAETLTYSPPRVEKIPPRYAPPPATKEKSADAKPKE